MCPMIRTPFPLSSNIQSVSPRCRCFIHQTRRRRKGRGRKRKGKGVEKTPQLLFQLDPIRQAVGRDVLAFAATSGLIILLCLAICLTEKLLQSFTSTSNSDTGSRKYQMEEFMNLSGGTDMDTIFTLKHRQCSANTQFQPCNGLKVALNLRREEKSGDFEFVASLRRTRRMGFSPSLTAMLRSQS